ncbi:helix-turn-helix domain-containing protein [Paenibacillus doosanensis]|uniref:HTH-type transcriptional regulator YesS n=1 Tax=Paenibacillus konkukensis TaxID=2020716 RepID=A0ABY4RII3_9BACL|nr:MULTISPECIES: helix-turn-helix domain-containing protein [Paenibacillus]MCS7463982.1 helix-turn-helix domain-containing protein [Paenibacillus doosanensis]UQZ81424.1 HTH-type transcriptional regulator YesS [Paenibacillus konkukensis]
MFQGNITARFKMIYGIVFLMIISATVWLSYLSSKSSLEDQLKNTNIALLSLVQQKIEMMLREIDTNTINFIQEPEVAFLLNGQYTTDELRFNHFNILNAKFKTLMNANSNISSFYLYSIQNKSMLTDSTYADEADFYDMSWLPAFNGMTRYQQWLDTRPITQISNAFQLEKNVISLVRQFPLISNPQFRKGAIIVNVDERTIADLMEDVDKQRLGQTLVVSEQGTIISSQNKQQLYAPLDSLPAAPALEQMQGTGYAIEDTPEGSFTTFYVSSAYNGWKYISIVPNPVMNRPLEITRNLLLAIAAGMCLVAIALVYAVSSYTFRPLDRFFRSFAGKKMERPGDLTYMEKFFKQMMSDNESLQKQMHESLPALKWRLIMSLLMADTTSYNRMVQYFDVLGIRFYDSRFVVMVIELDRIQEIASPRDVYLFTYAISNVAQELVSGVCSGVAVEISDGSAAAIMSFEEDDPKANQIQALQAADLVKDYVETHFKQTVTIGVGSPHLHLKGIHRSYQEALNALKYKLIMGENTVISVDDITGNHNDQFYRIWALGDSVVGHIRNPDETKLEEQLDVLFGQIIASSVPPEMIKQMCIQLIMKSIKAVSEKGLDIKRFLDPNENIYYRIDSCGSVDEIKRYIASFLKQLIVLAGEKREGKGSGDTIGQVIRYLEQHYMDSDLSLNLMASQFGLSVPYLSKLFKETTETNFMDHLIRIRMEKSKELLADPKLKIGAIAESVGYNNPQSFIRIFKKYTGLTPGEYRETTLHSGENQD